ncbi:MAG: hypothetical protein HYT12_03210 [Candidatus Liptonbacteria bacterium]|nr:hypothetical protein [Candidatus Liptonbacteria bacterium]
MSKYGHREHNWFEAIVNRLGGEEAAESFLRGELEVKEVEAFFRVTGKLSITIPALPRPTLGELQSRYGWMRSVDDSSTTEEATLVLGTVLRSGEDSIGDVVEYERRLAPLAGKLLGFQHAEWLVANQDRFPKLAKVLGKVYIDFPGIFAVDGGDDRSVPCLELHDERVCLHWPRPGGDDVRSGDRVASSK